MKEDRSPAARNLLTRHSGLDGVRALCLLAVLLFHSGFRWAEGGFLGVTSFFVLSGFLITGLLVLERERSGTIRLPSFWARRARRLAPAVIVLFALVIAYLKYGATRVPSGVAGDGFASALWFANWRFTFAHRSYAALFSGSSPFEHMWSLSVEEQVYLLLPIIVIIGLGRRLRAGGAKGDPATTHRARLAVVLVALVAASTATNVLLHHSGQNPLHEYYGTDARAAEPLAGALLALVLFGSGGIRKLGRSAVVALDMGAGGAVIGLIYMIHHFTQDSDGLYRGGFLVAACLSAVVVAAATQPGAIGNALSAKPLQAVGRISYGGYLFHWPIFLWMTPARTGLEAWPLLLARVAATLALATASYKLVEQPIRLGRIRWPEVAPAWSIATVMALAGLVLVSQVGLGDVGRVAVGTKVASGADFHAAPRALASSPTKTTTATSIALAPAVAGRSVSAALIGRSQPTTPPPTAAPRTTPTTGRINTNDALYGPITPPPQPPPNYSSYPIRVAVVGDSMADGLSYGLEQWASTQSGVAVYDLATPGCPLSRGGTRRFPDGYIWAIPAECTWWSDPSSDRSRALAQFKPNVIVLQDGMNELTDRKLPSWPNYRHTGEPDFDTWLLSEYQADLKVFTDNNQYHARVLSLNAVCADWTKMGDPWTDFANGPGQARVASLDATSAELTVANTEDVDYESYLCPNGQFTQTVAGVPNARPDGYHLSQAASTAVADQWLGPMIMNQGLAMTGPTPPSTTPGTTLPGSAPAAAGSGA